jgi:predicted acetyltransferase
MPAPLLLRSLTPVDEPAFRRAFASWDTASDNGYVFARGFDPSAPFAAYLSLVEDHERGLRLPEGFVPYTSRYAFVGPEMVGMLTIRHELNDFLFRIGGHIGYGVVPPHRRKGYATEMLRQALPLALRLGIRRALVTCDEPNIASARTIEVCGGVYENSTDMGPGLPPKRRYWIANEG